MSGSSKTVKSFLAIVVLNALLAYPVVYLLYKHFSPVLTPMDIHTYMTMTREGTASIEPPHRYRYVTPLLVRAMTFLPGYGVPVIFSDDPGVKKDFFHFLVLNFAITVATSGLLFFYLRDKVGKGFAYLGSLFYLFSFPAFVLNLIPMSDASCHLAIIACILLMEGGRPVWFALAMIAGMFTRETLILVLLPWIVLQALADRRRLLYILYTLPAAIVYFAVTRIDPAVSSQVYYQPSYLLGHAFDAFIPGRYDLSLFFHIFLSHLPLLACLMVFLWLRVFRRENAPAFNPGLLLFFFLVWLGITLGLGNNTGRLVFMAFPAVIEFEMRVLRVIVPRLGFTGETA